MDTPYIYPVLCVFYQLRRFGERLPDEEVKQRPVEGMLLVEKQGNRVTTWARRLDPKTRVPQDELQSAEILKVDGGVLVAGWEEHPGRAPTRQTWWCVPGHLDDLTAPP